MWHMVSGHLLFNHIYAFERLFFFFFEIVASESFEVDIEIEGGTQIPRIQETENSIVSFAAYVSLTV